MPQNLSYDLEMRTTKFGENIIELCKNINPTIINQSIISQIIKSATSIGANYMEANGASSKKDFRNKIYICKKESQETKFWLKMLLKSTANKQITISELSQECQELILIFSKIASTLNSKLVSKILH